MKNRDFRIAEASRQALSYETPLFETDDRLNRIYRQSQELSFLYNTKNNDTSSTMSAASLNAVAVLHLVYETVISYYLKMSSTNPFTRVAVYAEKNEAISGVLKFYEEKFPSKLDPDAESGETGSGENPPVSSATPTDEKIREFFVHWVYRANPAILDATLTLLNQKDLVFPQGTQALKALLGTYLQGGQVSKSSREDLFGFLTYPARLYPNSLPQQIRFILEHWADILPEDLRIMLLRSLDYIAEENHPRFSGPGQYDAISYEGNADIESFSEDKNWMPNVVMMAKSTLVWLDQLSKKYKRDIHTLDAIPDEELDALRDSGFTALWLIGLWQRSVASKKIKQLCGNPDAESSAYSLKGYVISDRIGGWQALCNLRERCDKRGIRLASDMVPNHMGLDSDWLVDRPELFTQTDWPPFPSYTYNGPDVSDNPAIEVKIEDHYYNRTDAAVTFRLHDRRSGRTTYVFHGNDGTSMPWNDTAQLDFLKPETREAVIQQILEVARNFHIIRFDAAMTLAKKHIQRLWYPRYGQGGDIAGRSNYAMSDEEFNRRIPVEFWREVVDRIASEVPDTLLLAEAFWMMESYFVRTLGMHRVYNSAFMHMMKNQDNKKYRDSIKNTLLFDPEILKRYVNFMNNPDEETAIAQFGDGDKYFGICTLLATMPGLPMFGHGQIQGFREKYGMEYQRAYWDEKPNQWLVDEHKRRIFPLLRMRWLFSGCANFDIFDVVDGGNVQESIYAYTNGENGRKTLVLYNNQYDHAQGKIYQSAPKVYRTPGGRETRSQNIAEAFGLSRGGRRYLVYRNFTEGLWYLCPSFRIFDDGYWVSLNGYETRVLTDIHEVEDIDGIYEKLYNRLQGRGVRDIGLETILLQLEPYFEITRPLASQKFLEDLRVVLRSAASPVADSDGHETRDDGASYETGHAKIDIMQTLGGYYTYVEELEGLFEKLGLKMKSVKPQEIMARLDRIDEVSRTELFSRCNTIMGGDLTTILSASFAVLPFIGSFGLGTYSSVMDILRVFPHLMLDRLYGKSPEVLERASILLASSSSNSVEEYLQDDGFRHLIQVNHYKGELWYKGDNFQECLILLFLARALDDPSFTGDAATEEKYRQEIDLWLHKDLAADYKLDNLRS